MHRSLRGTIVAVAVALLCGCAARGAPRSSAPHAAEPREPLSEFLEKVRHLSAAPRISDDVRLAETLEARDSAFAADLRVVRSSPTAEAHRRLAARYREHGVLDMAYRHFNRAVALNPRDADAHEGLARVWRDWKLPQLALGDAHRAVYHAPASASARNTYGTVMHALGRYEDARSAYALAARLDPGAAYAVNNQCYLSFVLGEVDAAIELCTQAMRMDPSLRAAQNNLALAFAASGRVDLARAHFLDAGDTASGLYNTGIVYLAAGDPQRALDAFDGASRARATFHLARERARQIRTDRFLNARAERESPADGR